jgi:hypothetical protein
LVLAAWYLNLQKAWVKPHIRARIAQKMATMFTLLSTATTSVTGNWIDGYIDYWV